MLWLNIYPLSSVKPWFLSFSCISSNGGDVDRFFLPNFFKSTIVGMSFGSLIGFKSLFSYKTGSHIYQSRISNGIQNSIFVIRFYLKGLGYKFIRFKALSRAGILRVELGFSVVSYFAVPRGIKIFGKKNRFVFVGVNNKRLLKNFSGMIYKLRPEDAYKGKGIRTSLVTTKVFKSGKQRLFFIFLLQVPYRGVLVVSECSILVGICKVTYGVGVVSKYIYIYISSIEIKMNLIFGKSQVVIQQFRYKSFELSFGKSINSKTLLSSFKLVYGFGKRRANWFSSSVGFSSSGIKMPFVFSNRFVDREYLMSNLYFSQPFRRLAGKELLTLVDKYKENKISYGSFKLSPRKIKSSKKGGGKSKKMSGK